MKLTLVLAAMLAAATSGFAATCAPGTLQDYINLGAGGCAAGPVMFANFATAPGQSFASPIDPSLIGVIPGGTLGRPNLQFTANMTAGAGELLESFFQFDVTAPILKGASMTLGAGSFATSDGVVIASADVCPDGSFAGNAPIGCPNVPASLVTFAASFGSSLSDSVSYDPMFFDVFVDLTIDGGPSGSAFLDSATFGVTAVPEPATIPLAAAGLAALVLRRVRRGR